MFHYHVEQYISIQVHYVPHIILSLFNHSGYALMIKEHTLCWDKKKYTTLYTEQ